MFNLRRARLLTSFVLVWFVMSLGVAVASPVVQPRTLQIVCTGAGALKVVLQTDDGAQELGAGQMDCPLCVLAGAPPPAITAPKVPSVLPLGLALQSIPAARLAAATAAPPPARGPPRFS